MPVELSDYKMRPEDICTALRISGVVCLYLDRVRGSIAHRIRNERPIGYLRADCTGEIVYGPDSKNPSGSHHWTLGVFECLTEKEPEKELAQRKEKKGASAASDSGSGSSRTYNFQLLARVTPRLTCYVPSGRINLTWIWDRFAEYTRRKSSVSRRQRLGRYAERDQGQGAKAQGREGIPQDIKAKGFIRECPSTYTTRAGAFKPSNPNTQPQTLISQSNQRPYKSAVTSVTYHTPIRAQAHPDPSGPALGVIVLLSHRPKRADVILFKELLGHLRHKRNITHTFFAHMWYH
ncbi:hypothetical protein EDB83DRAFT_2313104 [Lactarius deliciosus]|nr:hypothetical protein EDB83DRAFT_2313104 [Lactarius deliciosus]